MNYFKERQLVRNFDKVAATYLQHAIIQKIPATLLIDQFKLHQTRGRILDLGSGPGTFCHSEHILDLDIVNFDLSLNMLNQGQNNIAKVCGNAVNLPFAANSFRVVISNLMLQWPTDKQAAFSEISRVLTDAGLVFFTVLVAPSLWQLQQSWQQIDELEHNLHFYSATDYLSWCDSANLEVIDYFSWDKEIYFKNILQLLKHFKLTGSSLPRQANSSSGLGAGLGGKKHIAQLYAYYPQLSANGNLQLNYSYLLVIARKKIVNHG